jgi:hypothetical protein
VNLRTQRCGGIWFARSQGEARARQRPCKGRNLEPGPPGQVFEFVQMREDRGVCWRSLTPILGNIGSNLFRPFVDRHY